MQHARILVAVASVVLFAAVALRVADPAPIARLRDAAFDSYVSFAPRHADPTFPVRVVAIDEASLAAFGQWPWPRRRFAALIDRLREAGATAIAVDLVMPEPDRLSPDRLAEELADTPGFASVAAALRQARSGDTVLGEAVAAAPVVMGFAADDAVATPAGAPRAAFAVAGDDPRPFVSTFRGAVSSLPAIGTGARGYGAVNWVPDRDQIVRRVPLLLSVQGVLMPSLALETLRVVRGETTVFVKSSGSSGGSAFGQRTGVDVVRVGQTVLPTTPSGELWLRFAPADARRTISAHRVLAPDFDTREVAGRIVLIGATAVGLLDIRATPLAVAVPGVEVHAQAVEQMLAGAHPVRPSYAMGAELSFLVGAGGLVAWLILAAGPIVAALAAAVAIVGVLAVSWFAYASAGLLLDPVYPALALAALYVSGSLGTYARTELERARVRAAFRHYVSPAVVDELARRPEKLVLGGELRDVTLLFADVRQFSQIAERLDASELIDFVNALFGPLSDVILDHRGTIDKYMGDGVMAFWNAPLDQSDHAADACRAALDMLRALEAFNGRGAVQAAAKGQPFQPVRIGIGVNTGQCAAGNFGSAQRFDYSVLGDAVNVAARLESLSKTYGAAIVCGQRTVEAASDLAFVEIDRVVLRGRSQAEQIYALIGDDVVARSPAFGRLALAHGRVLKAMANRDTAGAHAALEEARSLGIRAYAPLADYFAMQLEAGGAAPVGDG